MDWVTVLWSAAAGACLLMALVHGVIWCMSRRSWASLWFFVTALGVIGLMACEMICMSTEEPRVFERAVRWCHVDYLIIVIGGLGFIHSYFGTGRGWLLGLALGSRLLAVVANFTTGSSLHFIAIHRLGKMVFLGKQVTVPAEWKANPWVGLGLLASLFWLAYVMDASWRLWRTGTSADRRRAVLLGGSLVFFIALAPGLPGLVAAGLIKAPMNASLPFVGMVLAMNYELSRDILRAARMSAELKTSRQRLTLAAAAARLAVWEWDVPTDRIWVSNDGRAFNSVTQRGEIDRSHFISTLHPEDRVAVKRAMDGALSGPGSYAAEYRALLPDGSTRWISATGMVERDGHGRAILLRGVSMDFTERKLAESQMELQRQELAHLSRVSLLGEMAGTLAHELNQPLAAMLSNAQVGRRYLATGKPDLTEMAAIFDDIAADAKRAGGIIHGMRAMLKKDAPPETPSLHLNEAVKQVLGLLHSEIIGRKQEVTLHLDDTLPPARSNRVEFQQVLINLVINGLDAMKAESNRGPLKVATSRREDTVIVTVHDSGPGIPPEIMSRLFDPFFSTKPGGLGLGLAISRNIMERFGGELHAENHPDGGAVFRMVLPAAP
jgi:two-component system, LuxR family, sensor kinase FixL